MLEWTLQSCNNNNNINNNNNNNNNANNLTININNTHYMLFQRSRIKHTRCDIIMQGQTKNYVSTTKFLGIIIDSELKWNDHYHLH